MRSAAIESITLDAKMFPGSLKVPEPIVCLCPHCDAKLKLKNPELAGKKIKCPKCAEPFVVTPDETDINKSARRAPSAGAGNARRG